MFRTSKYLPISYFFRYYPSIYKLKNITQNDFHSGTVKAAKLPKVLKLSKVPKAVDFSKQAKLDQMVHNQTIKETDLLQEIAETKGKPKKYTGCFR